MYGTLLDLLRVPSNYVLHTHIHMSETISNLSDAGWAGTLVCGGLLVLLRLLRGKLVALEQQASAKLAAVLTQQLWRFSPTGLRCAVHVSNLPCLPAGYSCSLTVSADAGLGTLQQLQQGLSLLLGGACLGCLTLSVSARLVRRPHVAIALAVAPALFIWLKLGRELWRTHQQELRYGPQSRRAAPPPLALSEEGPGVRRLPVTVVTGFLGAGKSTLLKRILSEEHGKRLLVIENELGEEAIDHELLQQEHGREEVVVLKNGCLCCTVREDLRAALRALLPRAASLDGVLIETTGLARPGLAAG